MRMFLITLQPEVITLVIFYLLDLINFKILIAFFISNNFN